MAGMYDFNEYPEKQMSIIHPPSLEKKKPDKTLSNCYLFS